MKESLLCVICQEFAKRNCVAIHLTMCNNNCFCYIRQGDYVFVVVCLSVCLLATLRKTLRPDLHEIFGEDWQ